MTVANGGALTDYRITQQSAAVGIDPSGEIVLRKNGGLQGEGKWREWLDTLGGPRAAVEPAAPTTAAVPVAPEPVQAVPTTPPAPPTAAPAPTTAPVQPVPTVIPVGPITPVEPTAAPVPTVTPPPTATPRSAPTAIPRPTAIPTPRPTATPNIPVGHNVGQRAPDFTIQAVDGNSYTLSEVTASGKSVLIYFFATW